MTDFKEYMELFKTYSLKEKKDIAIEQLKLVANLSYLMCKELNVDNELLLTDEVSNVEHIDATEDDFVEAIIVYLNSIQNSLCDYNKKISELANINE